MTSVAVDATLCTGCSACLDACPHGAISLSETRTARIDRGLCRDCGLCVSACPTGALFLADSDLAPARAPGPEVVVARAPQPEVVRARGPQPEIVTTRVVDMPTVAKHAIWPTLTVAAVAIAREVLPVVVDRIVPAISRAIAGSQKPGLTTAMGAGSRSRQATTVIGRGSRFRRRNRGR